MVAACTNFLSFPKGMLRKIMKLHKCEQHRKLFSVMRALNAVQYKECNY